MAFSFSGLNAWANEHSSALDFYTEAIMDNTVVPLMTQRGTVVTGFTGDTYKLPKLSASTTMQDGDNCTFNADGSVTIGQATITALKAFALGLSSGVCISGFRNDPHQMFANGDANAELVAKSMSDILNGMFTMAKSMPDPASSTKTILDSLVWCVYGDTCKSFTNRSGWPDGTAMASNMLITYGAGFLKTGWFGGLGAADNQVDGWDPATGNTAPYVEATTGQAAAAAVCYAVAKGDSRASPFRGDLSGITNTVVI